MEEKRISINLLEEILTYIKESEEFKDAEYGSERDADELINDGKMPEIYFKVKSILE